VAVEKNITSFLDFDIFVVSTVGGTQRKLNADAQIQTLKIISIFQNLQGKVMHTVIQKCNGQIHTHHSNETAPQFWPPVQ